MLKYILQLCLALIFVNQIKSQELFTLTEPASNMPARSIGFRMNQSLMKAELGNEKAYHLLPEIMLGLKGKWMVHAEGFFSNRNKSIAIEGAQAYLKYRFLSVDEVHSHFRMALFGRYAINNADIHQDAIDLNGHNTGSEVGLVMTQLLHKVALSASASFVKASNNRNEKGYEIDKSKAEASNFTFSIGKLMLPKEYKTYKQTNLNLMMEFPGQTNIQTGRTFLDMAPIVQLIFFSQMRMDLTYRFPLINDLSRTYPRGWLLRLEYTLFNQW